MSGWFPRLSFDGKHVASGHLDITVDGQVIANDGLEPVWLDNTTVLFRKQTTGALMYWDGSAYAYQMPGPTGIGGNQVAAGGARWAVYRTDPIRIITNDGAMLMGVSDPGFSDDGQNVSYLGQSDGQLFVNGVSRGVLARIPRWGGTSLCWELNGAIFGIVTPGQRVTPLTILPRQYKPVPVWTGSTLLVLSHGDANVYLQLWGSTLGWVVTTGETDGPHDARPLDATHVRVVWSVDGVLKERTIDITTQAVDLTAAPPVDPPPVETLPDIPWTSDPIGTPFDVTALLRGSSTAEQNGIWWYRKNDPIEGDPWGAWLDFDVAGNVGLLADSSTGQDTADERINWMYFDGPRLWMPLTGLSGWSAEYDTDFVWRDGTRTHEHVRVVMESGYGRYGGVEMFFRHTYDPRHPDPSKPRKAGLLEYSLYSHVKEERFEEHRDDDHGVPQFVRAVQPTPFTGKEAFVAPPRPQPYGPIAWAPVVKPSITIRSDYGPKQGKAPHTWEATAITTGKVTSIVWRWRKQGTKPWTLKSDDSHTTVIFPSPGIYEIGVDCFGPGGTDGTATPRFIVVSA